MLKKIIKKISRKLNFIYNNLKPFPVIVKQKLDGRFRICHISSFAYTNAGDTLLPVVLRDLFNGSLSIKKWDGIYVRNKVSSSTIKKINNNDIMVIGGGGLFLKDSNRNEISGWQWPCSIDAMNKIKRPIIMFAVGYNRFRGQEDFEPYFKDNVNTFVKNASFVGLRNHGSIEAIKNYLDDEKLKQKLVFQPCMTTLISKIYPHLIDYSTKEDFVAFNCAFDRSHLRNFGESVLQDIAHVALELSKITKIKYFTHVRNDSNALEYFDNLGVEYELIEFTDVNEMIQAYSKPRLVIGMRGHAQMIPFGCQTPILSIVSHNKMQWFLDDIGHSDWGVDVLNHDFKDELLNKAMEAYKNYGRHHQEVIEAQQMLWDITQVNLEKIKKTIQ